jgi:hypothetical protein
MSLTADFQAQQPRLREKEQKKLNEDIANLLVKRKDLGRFLQIDKEKEDLLKLQIEAKKLKIKSQNVALDIVEKAKIEADGIRMQALKNKNTAVAFAKRQTEAAEAALADAKTKQMSAKNVLSDATIKDQIANENLMATEVGLKAMRSKVKRVAKTLSDMVG